MMNAGKRCGASGVILPKPRNVKKPDAKKYAEPDPEEKNNHRILPLPVFDRYGILHEINR